jgi:anthranilate/para-aminobenzoate synthase component II
MAHLDKPGVNEWALTKISDPQTLKTLLLKPESRILKTLLKSPHEQTSGILDVIEQSEELLLLLRKELSIVMYLDAIESSENSASPLVIEKLNKLIFAEQDSNQTIYEYITLLDAMLIATTENMTDIMSAEQIRNIQFSKVNTKFFNFGNYKLLAYLRSHSEGCSDEQILNKLQTDGASQTKVQLVKKLLKFTDEFDEGKLSEFELKLINNDSEFTVEEINQGKLNNSIGFDALFLGLSVRNYKLAKTLIENGYKFYEDNEFGLNKISLIAFPSISQQHELLNIIKFAHGKEHFPLKQQIANSDDYPLDLIINNYDDPDSYFIELSGGTLYKFKNPENINIDTLDKDRVSIAISHGNEFWSTDIFSATHYLQKQNPDVDFYVVNPGVIEQLGVAVFSAFDGWINPGAGDSYPKNKEEFSRDDWKPTIGTEHIYQNVLGNATIYNLPTFGMCAGAQNLVLHHGGYLKPIEGYSFGNHEITLNQGSSLTYLALSPEERKQFHQTGHIPTIKFKGHTAHHFVAVNGKLPAGFSLGAVSEHNEAMGYCDPTGIHCATQFHPEHYAGNLNAQAEAAKYQIQLLNGFIELARMNHNCKNDIGVCPTEFMDNAKAELDFYYGTCPLLGHDDATVNEVCSL